MSGPRPEVTVVIPTKDRWQLLSQTALPAALGQEDVVIEVIVVDDGSRDETPDRLHELARSDPRLSVLRHERPRGVSAARNTGIRAARGEWVAFLDDDDVWSPLKLRSQLASPRVSEAPFVYAGAVALDEAGHVLYTYYFPDPVEVRAKLLRSAVVPAGASNVLARTRVLLELGGFDESFSHLEDWDLWIRLSSVGEPAAVSDVLVGVLFHPRNKHAIHDQSAELEALVRKHAALDPPRFLAVDRQGHARWVASQHSRAGMHRRAASLYLRSARRYRSPGDILRSLDALLAKRPGSLVSRRGREDDRTLVATRPPDWLGRFPVLASDRR
jgi:GT2 family glycosyltransferase